jgi:predicted nuclease of predicted toxin-antitoxin system/uncharacterized protein (DUF433 family)
MSRLERITVDSTVCHGQPVVRGMRYPVQSLLELLASGMTIEEILADYPDLEREDPSRRIGVRRVDCRRASSRAARYRVKFLVDAQLPARLANFLNRAGHQAIHTSDLPNGNASTDAQVVEIADAESRVVITKDRDFRDSHLLSGSPRKLFIVATGNISNDALIKLFEVHLGTATSALDGADLVELRAKFLVVHPRRDRGPEKP